MASALLMMIGTVVGLSLLIVGLKEGTPQAIVWPVLLHCTTALPLLLVLVGALFWACSQLLLPKAPQVYVALRENSGLSTQRRLSFCSKGRKSQSLRCFPL
jgi:hypothetical protein